MPVLAIIKGLFWLAGGITVATIIDQSGEAVKDAGDGINTASDGLVKGAIAASVMYLIYQKVK